MLVEKRGFFSPRSIRNLYVEAFPKKERIPFFFFFLFCLSRGNISRYYLDGNFCAFTVTIKTSGAVFLVFFAVKKEYRGMGIGTSILDILKSSNKDKTLVADVEDPSLPSDNAEQRLRRVAFYEKNGLRLTSLALDEYCGRLLLVSAAPLSEQTAANLCARATFLRWTYRLHAENESTEARSDDEIVDEAAKTILARYRKAFEELAK